MHFRIAVVICAVWLSPIANATVITGSFNGDITGASGSENGLDLTGLVGLAFSGTFSFDSASLVLTASSSANRALYDVSSGFPPIVITQAVGGYTFSITSAAPASRLEIDSALAPSAPDNLFELASQNVPGIPLPGDSSGQILFGLYSTGAPGFASNGLDPGTTNFHWTSAEGFGSGGTVFSDAGGHSTGRLDFSVTSAFASAVPEPYTITLLTLGLSGIGFSRRARKS